MQNKLIAIMLIIYVMIGCNKNAPEIIEKKNIISSAPPPNVPTYLLRSNDLIHQYYRLSIGFLKAFTDPNICNNKNLLDDLTTRITNNGSIPISINSWYNGLDNINFPFNQPATSDLYDVLAPIILNNNPPTSINSWQTNFFGSFLGPDSLNSPYAGNFYTTIGVPDLAYQITNNQNKPIVVLPDPEYLPKSLNSTNPVYGYTWNSSTNSISEIIITDINQYYDLIEDGNYFVIALSFNTDEIEAKDVHFDCTEQWQPNDGYCDGNCGENSINSPNDCNQQSNRKNFIFVSSV